MLYRDPFLYSINPTFLQDPHLSRFRNDYPEEEIRAYCSNPDVSEHESSLWGNFSSPVHHWDFIVHNIQHYLNTIKYQFLTGHPKHDHHYVNYHMDEPGSYLEIHNDIKNFRWLITSQIYLDSNDQGVSMCDLEGNVIKKVPEVPGQMYSIFATPHSWHMVDELTQLKRSILFRVGKRRHKTVAHPDPEAPAWIIVNDGHDDTHYAKLAERMGNYTEAWLHHKGHKNIYHTDKNGKLQDKVLAYVEKKHNKHTVIQAGEFPGWGEWIITGNNYEETWEHVIRKRKYSSFWLTMEKCLLKYYAENQQLVYQDVIL